MTSYKFKINGKAYAVEIKGIDGKHADVTVNGAAYDVELEDALPSAPAAPKAVAPAPSPAAQAAAPASASAPVPAGAGSSVKSPLPGVIISIDVKEGQGVKKGQKVAVLEAMKMENEILADADGTISAILVQKGDSVLEGAEILKIA